MSSLLFKLGVIADIQYIEKPNGSVEGRVQRYSEAPGKLEQAVSKLNDLHADLVLTVGDIIDGRKPQDEEDRVELRRITSILSSSHCPVANTLGNHDVSLERSYILQELCMPASYYARSLCKGWRLLVLDTTDLSTGTENRPCWPADSPKFQEAKAFLEARPLDEGANVHMVGWNGGLGKEQMEWLKCELERAQQAGERVIVSSHHPFAGARRTHMAWNYEEVRALLVASKACCVALAGHDHEGGYERVGRVHFVTQPALLEAPEGSNAFALLKVYADRIDIEGHGTVPRRTLEL